MDSKALYNEHCEYETQFSHKIVKLGEITQKDLKMNPIENYQNTIGMTWLRYRLYTIVTPGLLHFAIFCTIFEKNTAKNTTNPGNSRKISRTVTLF